MSRTYLSPLFSSHFLPGHHSLSPPLRWSTRRILRILLLLMTSTDEQDLVRGEAGVTTDDQTNANARRAAGEFVRGVSTARNWIGSPQYPPAAGRYHLYVANNCPWCHRVLLARSILGLQDVITVDVLFPNRSSEDEPLGPNLWKFEPQGQVGLNGKHVQFESCTNDSVFGKKYVQEIYQAAGIQDQKSVPILFDKESRTVVNNESAEILRMFATYFRSFSKTDLDIYPDDKVEEINKMNDWIYADIANGSYKAGFSSSQDVYETAYRKFFNALNRLEEIFARQTFLVGDTVTEADIRLFPPLFRLDPVYYARFKLNEKYLWEYPHTWRWMGDMMKLPGLEPVANAEYLQHCKQGYFGRTGNGTVPLGPPGYPECYKEKHWSHEQ